MNKKVIISIISVLAAGLLIFLDQLSKSVMVDKLSDGSSITFINHVIDFVYVENTGSAWGMLSGKMVFFYIITVILVGIIVFFFVKMPATKRFIPLRVCTVLIFAGAIGNFIDRVMLNYVRDFIEFSFVDFPVFNVADVYITLGVAATILFIIFKYREKDFSCFSLRKKKEEKVNDEN